MTRAHTRRYRVLVRPVTRPDGRTVPAGTRVELRSWLWSEEAIVVVDGEALKVHPSSFVRDDAVGASP